MAFQSVVLTLSTVPTEQYNLVLNNSYVLTSPLSGQVAVPFAIDNHIIIIFRILKWLNKKLTVRI